MKLSLGFSPCPNDTFIFDAIIHHKIDTEGLTFEVTFDDVETLNQKAFNNHLDITKLSYHAYAYAINHYVLLDAGSALGFGVGPLLIAKEALNVENKDLLVGIPGKYTTANFLLSLAYPHLQKKKELVFSDIEQQLLNNQLDLGLIIHENRFTYADKGLSKWMDLGTYFEETFNAPIPLGGIIARNDINANEIAIVDDLIKQSVEYAFANSYDILPDYVKCHSQEMSEEVMRQHIHLYVNDFTMDMGDTGRKAIEKLVEVYSH